jgi:hypothetical protein
LLETWWSIMNWTNVGTKYSRNKKQKRILECCESYLNECTTLQGSFQLRFAQSDSLSTKRFLTFHNRRAHECTCEWHPAKYSVDTKNYTKNKKKWEIPKLYYPWDSWERTEKRWTHSHVLSFDATRTFSDWNSK